MNEGSHVIFCTSRGTFDSAIDRIYEGVIVSDRLDRFGCVTVERLRTNPAIREARWLRRPDEMIEVPS